MNKLILGALALVLAPSVAAAADLTGTWSLKVNVGDQAVPVTCNLTQSAAAIGGTCHRSDQDEKPAAVTGAVDGSAVKLAYDVDFQDMPLHIAYTGKLDSDTAMSGTLDVAGQSGTFTGTKP